MLALCVLLCAATPAFAVRYEAAPGLDALAGYLKTQPQAEPVTVAVIDSGVAALPAFGDRLTAGYDFVDDDADPTNDFATDSHGTFIASVILAATEGLPVQMMPVRVLESKNVSKDALVRGIYYAVDNGADILNLSIGGTLTDCSEIDAAVAYAEAQGVVVVAAAGNEKKRITNYCPAHIESAITVSAVDENGAFEKRYSNYGDAVDCCAPGDNVSGVNALGKTVTHSGTSFSAAYVSAGAAMLKLLHPEYTASQVQNAIKAICIDLGEPGADPYYGYGLPDFMRVVPASVRIAGNTNDLTVDYRTTVILHAETDLPFDGVITWCIGGEPAATGDALTLKNLTSDTTVSFTVSDKNGYTLTSEAKHIHVRDDLFRRILAFFRAVLRRLPVVDVR